MMYSKQEKQAFQLIAAAVLLGIFSLNPMAKAADADAVQVEKVQEPREVANEPEERDGISLKEFNRMLREPLQVRPNETNTDVDFLGDIPARCVYDKQGEMTASIDYDTDASTKDRHVFRVHVPLCENIPNFKRKPGEKMVKVSSIPGARKLKDVKGKVVLASGFKDSDSKPTIEELKHEGKAIEIASDDFQRMAEQAAMSEAAQKQLAAREESDRKAAIAQEKADNARLAKQAELQCKEGDFVGLDKTFDGIPELKEHVGSWGQKKLLAAIDNAETADEARDAYEAYNNAAESLGWERADMRKASEKYSEKRMSLINAAIADLQGGGEGSLKDAEKMVDEWAAEFKGFDSKAKKKGKDDLAVAYGNLGAIAQNGSKKNAKAIAQTVASTEKLYKKAKKYANASDKNNIEGALAKLNGQAFTACVKADPARMVECESKYREKTKTHSENYATGLAQKAKNGDEEAAAEVQAFAQDFLKAEGYGQSMNYAGFGTLHQMPGFFEQTKMQSLQEMQMRAYQQQMSQMYGGMGMGMGMGAGMQQRTSFFGF